MDGCAPILFDLRTPGDADTINANIAHAMSLGLPSVQRQDGKNWSIDLFASGPSAKGQPQSRCTAAVNNALRLFQKSSPPTFWIACDPQEIVSTFIPEDPPQNTTYLVATKCHPSVFKKLKDRNVKLWQIDDYDLQPDVLVVPTAVSVTLCAINLLAQMGYTNITTYGWDGCYIEGEGYAVPQPHNRDNVTVHLKDQTFNTTTTWACEAEDARAQFIRDQGHYRVKIEGPGMIGAIARHFGLAS